MDIKLPSGKYVLAVSGGVDSVVLLDLLVKKPRIELTVAHFDHGIRPDSPKDAAFVEALAKKYGLKYELAEGGLGPNTSEEKARTARYAFLKGIMAKNGLDGIITAHHQDDVIETVLINLLRGSGSAGLISLASKPDIKRPLLSYSKKQLLDYAKRHNLEWREDETNQDRRYLRNYLRLEVILGMTDKQKQDLIKNVDKVAKTTERTNEHFATLSQYIEDNNKIKRGTYNQLNNQLAEEYLYRKLRKLGSIDRKTISRINVAIRTAKPGLKTNITGDKFLVANKEYAWVE